MTISTVRFFILAVLAGVLAALVFSPGLSGGFVLDDVATIVQNPAIVLESLNRESLLNAAASFGAGHGTRPLSMLSFAFDVWRHGSVDVATMKATNLLIHGLTTLVLAVFLRRLLMLAKWTPQHTAMGALLLALVWAVHPLQVSAVLYVVQRMQTLATLFLLLALWAYLGLRQAQINGARGWPYAILTALCWVLALLSKEDAIMLPAYCLLLELTVLRFAAAEAWRAHSLRRAYLVMTVVGVALYLFWLLPTYWSEHAYPGRDFNSMERLLTEARVLVMYLGQIVWPLPSHMPFNYDDFAVSRGLMQPFSTLLALLLMIGLLIWAWWWRQRRPLFAFGVLLFFTGHFVTSNVLSLELVFEHRNHFPLIGALLALGDLLVAAWQRRQLPAAWLSAVSAVLIVGIGVAGGVRAHIWGDEVRLAKFHVEIAPDSPRAWLELGGTYFDLAGRKSAKGSPYLDKAIETMEIAAARTGSPSAYSNIVIYKSIQGTVTQADWDRLLHCLEDAEMTPPTRNILWTTMANMRAQVQLDEVQALRVIDLIIRRTRFPATDYLSMGAFIFARTSQKQAALPYFLHAAEGLPTNDPNILTLCEDLRAQGKTDWVQAIQAANSHSNTKSSIQ